MGVTDGGAAPLRTVDRALQLLLAFDASHTQWRASDLARHLGWDKSVTHRLLVTLVRRGFLLVDARTRSYRLGPSVYDLGQVAASDNPLVVIVRPLLRDLARRTGESMLFTVPDGHEALCLAGVDGPAPVRYSTPVGGRVPGHAGAGAKVLFAWRSEWEQRRLFGDRRLARFTDATTTDVEALLAEFAEIRRTGVSFTDGELDPDVGAVSVPVGAGPDPIGGLAAVGPLTRVQRERDRLAEVLREAADGLAGQLTAPSHLPDFAPVTH